MKCANTNLELFRHLLSSKHYVIYMPAPSTPNIPDINNPKEDPELIFISIIQVVFGITLNNRGFCNKLLMFWNSKNMSLQSIFYLSHFSFFCFLVGIIMWYFPLLSTTVSQLSSCAPFLRYIYCYCYYCIYNSL